MAIIDSSLILHSFTLCTVVGKVVKEIVEFPLCYADLIPGSKLVLTIGSLVDGKPERKIVLELFENGFLRQGKFKLPICRDHSNERLEHLEAVVKSFEEDPCFPLVPWMDEIALDLVDQIRQEDISKGNAYLVIELQRFDHPVRYSPVNLPVKNQFNKTMFEAKADIVDLVRNKPLSWNLISDERILIWKYRKRLTGNPRALLMFLKSVDWVDEEEVKLVEGLLSEWHPLDPISTLELLASLLKKFISNYFGTGFISLLSNS